MFFEMRECQVRLVDDQKICFFLIPVRLAKSDVAAHNSSRAFGFISCKKVTEPGNVNRKKDYV